MQGAPQIFFQSLDIVLGIGWLVLLAINAREVLSYAKFVLLPSAVPTDEAVSVVIPARNEERRITATLDSVMRQSARNLEIIVLDDRSTDGTSAVVEKLRAEDGRVKLVRGEELPPGWAGKNWACSQGFKNAHHDWILFLDSDTRLVSSAIASSIARAEEEGLEALSLIPRAEYSGFWARVAGPVLTFLIRLAYPLRRVNDPADKLAIAVGGFLLLRRRAYVEIGGHEAVKGELVEDKEIGANLKAHSIPFRLLVGRVVAVTGLFTGEQGLWNSIRRVVTNPLKSARWRKLGVVVAGLLLLLFPSALLLSDLATGMQSATDILIAGISLSAPIAIVGYDVSGTSPRRFRYALLSPLGAVVVMLAIARQIFGGSVGWRGRNYAPSPPNNRDG